MGIFRMIACVVIALGWYENAGAWCLGPKGCVTDETVCDLGQDTLAAVGRQQFVQADALREAEIYSRLAASKILQHCRDGQELLINSVRGLPIEKTAWPEVARSFCKVSDVSEQQITSTNEITGDARHGFSLKCRISKMAEARAAYEAREAQVTTQALLDEANAPPPAAGGGFPDPFKAKAGCGKITFGSLIGMGPCSGKQ